MTIGEQDKLLADLIRKIKSSGFVKNVNDRDGDNYGSAYIDFINGSRAYIYDFEALQKFAKALGTLDSFITAKGTSDDFKESSDSAAIKNAGAFLKRRVESEKRI